MENSNPSPAFDAAKYVADLHAILSTVSVSGQNNIHNMDMVLGGLQYLHGQLREKKNEKESLDEI